VTAGGQAVSEPYYSQHARSVCISLSAFFICSFAMNMALTNVSCETWKFTPKRAEEVRQSHDKMLRCDWLDAVDLSKTSCSQTALNGFVLDMSGSGQAKRICQAVVDKSVSGLLQADLS